MKRLNKVILVKSVFDHSLNEELSTVQTVTTS